MNTIQLDSDWDLLITDGTLTVATGNLALVQDVASACRTFLGEVWYAPLTQGVPYYQQILGRRVSLQLVKQAEVTNGMLTPGVGAIKCFLTGPDKSRRVGGQLQVFNAGGQLAGVTETGSLAGLAPWWVSAVSYEASGATT